MVIKRYSTIFFDLFHTLVDVGAIPDSIGRYTADVLGVDRRTWNEGCFSAHHDICRPTNHIDTIRTLAHAIDPSIPESLIEEAVGDRQRRFDYTLKYVPQPVIEAITQLRECGYRIGLISNASTAEVAAWEDSPLAPLFDTAVFSCDCGYRKPQPEIYHHAMSQLGVRAEEALFVGDGGSDEHRGAGEVGLTSVLVTEHISGMDSERLAQRRRYVAYELKSVIELPSLLAQ